MDPVGPPRGVRLDSRSQVVALLGFVLLMLMLLPAPVQSQDQASIGCPSRCLCFRTTVRCMFLQLDKVPRVPPGTTILDLRFNRIREIPPGTFKDLQELNTLLLNNNHIRRIDNGAFDGLNQLRYLYLYKNEIETIDKTAFHGLSQLEQLYIHFNKLRHLEPDTFSKLPALERLFLHNNKLKTLPKGVFSSLASLRRLRLDSNALICDCQLMWLSEMLKENEGHTQAAVTCQFPDDVQGKSLLSVPSDEFHCSKPTITSEPSDVVLKFGNTVKFTCHAEGDPQPEIIWLHNNQEIVTNQVDEHSRYNLLEDGSLMIEEAQNSDQGVYECVARNAAGEAKASAVQLRYTTGHLQPVRPEILRGPSDHQVAEGEAISLTCLVSGNPEPVVLWTINDLPLHDDQRFELLEDSTLRISNLRFSDRGLYRCSAANEVGEVSDFARVEVLVAPSFSQRPHDQRIVEGHSAFFSCDVTGDPTPTIRWTKDGGPLPNVGRVSVNPSKTTLTINTVKVADQGVYECIAESAAGRNVASVQLVVSSRVPPTLQSPPSDQFAREGSSVEFVCQVNGDPPPSVKWLRNSLPVALLDDSKYEIRRDGTLIIRAVQRGDAGVYECVAENVAGTTRGFGRLSIIDGQRGPSLDDNTISRAVEDSIERVNRAINNTIRDLHDTSIRRTPEDLLRLFRFPSRDALQISRAAEVFERTLEVLHQEVVAGVSFNISHADMRYEDLLSPTQLAIVASLSGCAEHRRVTFCDDMCFHHRYRTFDGTCNNLEEPMWGASLTPLARSLSPVYENGFNLPVGWNPDRLYNGFRLPSARVISLQIASAPHVTEDTDYTHMLMQWGQFVDHDINFVPLAVSNARFSDGRFCNESCDYQAPCFPIQIPPDDPRIHRHRCMGVTRSSAMCGSGMTSLFFNRVFMREQINEITSFMDGSQIYASSNEQARNLRDFTSNRGLLRTGVTMPSGKSLLPPNNGEPIDCQMDPNAAHVPCFQAGDVRVNEQLGLLSMHTLWLREHNRIATRLLELNPHWDGDTVYHESRKLVGAEMQHITYTAWLPKILGPRGMEMMGTYRGYDPNMDPSIRNEFATSAFRFGHSLVNAIIYRLNSTFQPIPEGNLPLHRAFFAPYRVVEEGGIDPILRGMFGRAAKRLLPGEFLNQELTERLFKLAHEVALDLAALNIQRGRDHGLPSYNAFRRHCGLREATTFSDLRTEISSVPLLQKLQEVYGHPDNVDSWVGGLAEDTLEGSRLGPTFMCIISDQFKRIRDGDRFWYENPGVLSTAQLVELRQASLARVICDNSDGIEDVQEDVFLNAQYPQGYRKCERIPRVNMRVWAHCCYDCSQAGDFRSLTSHSRGRRSTDYIDLPQSDQPTPNRGADLAPGRSISAASDQPDPHRRAGETVAVLDEGGTRDGKASAPEAAVEETTSASISRETMEEEVAKMSNKMMDSVDNRIEGMEDVMAHLQKTVHRLSRKLRRLEKAMHGSKKNQNQCIDHLGNPRQNKDRWKIHDCRICYCKVNKVECTTEICHPPPCQYPRKIPGQCCPACP